MGVKALLWFDLEATGLSAFEHCVLEVGAVLTPFEDFDDHQFVYEEVLGLTSLGYVQLFGGSAPEMPGHPSSFKTYDRNEFLVQMHNDSGLLEDAHNSDATVHDVDTELSSALRDLGYGDNELAMAGSGVAHYDMQFIHAQFPQLDKLLHYAPGADLGLFRRAWKSLGGDAIAELQTPSDSGGVDKKHRALADVLAHIREGQAYQQQIASAAAQLRLLKDLQDS